VTYENGSRACLRMTMHSASVDGIEVRDLFGSYKATLHSHVRYKSLYSVTCA